MAHTLDSFSDTGDLENLKDNYQKITSVLAGHQIAFWEYDIPTGECNFTDEYFHILGLKEAGIIFRDINDFYRFAHPEDVISYQTTFARMLESETKISQILPISLHVVKKKHRSGSLRNETGKLLKHYRSSYLFLMIIFLLRMY